MQQAQEKKSQQHDPFSNQFYEDLQSAKIRRSTSKKNRKTNRNTNKDDGDYSSFFKKMGIIGLAAILGIGIYSAVTYEGILPSVYEDDYVVVEDLNDPEDEGYLHAAEMNIFDEDGNPYWTDEQLSHLMFYYFKAPVTTEVYYTPGGLTTGSTWEDFIEVFGEYYFYEISYDGDISGTVRNHAFGDNFTSITVSDFHTQYVESGFIDLDETQIQVEFRAYFIGDDVIYDTSEYYSQINGNEDRHGDIAYTFTFANEDSDNQELSDVNVFAYLADDDY